MVDWLKGKGFGGSNEIDHLTKTINEQSDDQRKIITQFNKAMNEFATERSLETCLDALNLSMQLANIRGKLAESYEYYSRLLEHHHPSPIQRSAGTISHQTSHIANFHFEAAVVEYSLLPSNL
jgi:hypothetical protein